MNRNIKYIVIDVDGTMTDSGIYYDDSGNEIKKFCARDAAGFFAAKNVGIKTIVLTGRESLATNRRMRELKVDYLYQGIKNKAEFLNQFMLDNDISKQQMAYIGDDLNDMYSMLMAGHRFCPCDACEEIKKIADYISPVRGGCGVVTDVIKHILCETGEWNDAIEKTYGTDLKGI